MTTPNASGFPLQVFAPMSRDGRYTGTAACVHVLEGAREKMGLTKYQLGRILGTASVASIYHWFAGRYRPSSLFLTRLAQLFLMDAAGVPLYNISYIDWERSKVHWRNGEVDDSADSHLVKTRRTLPTVVGARKPADMPIQVGRPALGDSSNAGDSG